MLQLTVTVEPEQYDEKNQKFVSAKTQTLQMEHSLVSISKWESKWCKSFLSKQEKTSEEILDYIQCMTLTQNVDPKVYMCLTNENIRQINEYIDAPMTATVFYDDNNHKGGREIVTAELIYYWMIALNIPFECQKWHLNRLLTLIKVCNIKNTPPKKMSKSAIARRNAALNASRKRQLNTKG